MGTKDDAVFPLPALQKTIIYLDQLMISDMMKALNPKTKAHQEGRVRAEWQTAFEKLDSLCKLQLVVCPDSSFHVRESCVSPHYASLKRIYELLSHGVSFHDSVSIKNAQLHKHVMHWLSDQSKPPMSLDRGDALSRDAHNWQDRTQITIKSDYVSECADDIRKGRKQANACMQAMFDEWQTQKSGRFCDWYESEVRGFRDDLVEACDGYIEQRRAPYTLRPQFACDQEVQLVLRACLQKAGNQEDACKLMAKYFRTADFTTLLYIRVAALLFGGIARRAAAGQRRPPSQGMVNDINMVSTILPYCDAALVDREIHGLLNEGGIRERLGFNARVFSPADFEAFFAHLEAIKTRARPEHLEQVREVYGDRRGKPFVEILTVDEG